MRVRSSRLKCILLGVSLTTLAAMGVVCTPDSKVNNPTEKTRGSISGTVTDQSGTPLNGAYALLAGGGYSSISDSTGAFRIPNVPYGSHDIHFIRNGYGDTIIADITIEENAVHVAISDTVRLTLSTCTLKGRVVRNSAPVRAAGVSVPYQPYSTITDANGVFELSDIQPDAESVYAAGAGAGWGEVTLTDLQPAQTVEDIEVAIDKDGGTIEGVIVDEAGVPVKQAVVTAMGGAITATTNDDGTYSLSGIPSGIPVLIKSGDNYTLGGLIVEEGAVLNGVTLKPQGETEGFGLTLHNREYLAPETGGVTISADVRAQGDNAFDQVALFLWDLDADGEYFDTVTSAPTLKVTTDGMVQYGIVTINGDKLVGGKITIQRVDSKPQITMGPEQRIRPGELASLSAQVKCLTGGVVGFEWDFDGDGVFDWKRADVTSTQYPYFTSQVLSAFFKTTTTNGTSVLDSLTITVVDTVPVATTVQPPNITSHNNNDEVKGEVVLSWADAGAESYSIYVGDKAPPESLLISGVTDTFYVVTNLPPSENAYLQVVALKDGESLPGLVTAVKPINSEPVLSNLTPANNAVVNGDSLRFTWDASDADNHQMYFNVYFDLANPPGIIEEGITEKSLWVKPKVPQQNVTYYWEVWATDGIDTVKSGLQSFKW